MNLKKIKEKIENYKRVLIVSRKPDKEEFKLTLKIIIIGVIIIGLFGFFFYIISSLFFG